MTAPVSAWKQEALARWPELVMPETLEVNATPGSAHGAEAVLVALALVGQRGALAVLERDYFAPLAAALEPRWRRETIEDALQSLKEKLLVGRQAQLRQWTADDGLARWLRLCAVKELTEAARGKPPVGAPDVAVSTSGELSHRHREALQRALDRAVQKLEPTQRGILKLHLLENIGVERIAQLHQVSRSTMTRWLRDARALLAEEVRAEARDALDVGDQTLDSLAQSLVAKKEVSLAGLLSSD